MRGLSPALAALAVSFVTGLGCGGSERGGSTPSAGGADGGSAGAGSAGAPPAAAGNSANAGSPHGGQSAGSGAGGASSAAGNAGEAAGGSASGGSASGGSASGGSASGLVDCDTRKVICKRVLPECPAMQVPSVVGTCYGECVKIDTCACSSAEQCPDAEQYTCWGKKHCGPYVE